MDQKQTHPQGNHRQVQLLSYEYPNRLTLLIKGQRYHYESSEFFCRRFINCLDKGAQFNALNWFKRVSRLVKREVIKEVVKNEKEMVGQKRV